MRLFLFRLVVVLGFLGPALSCANQETSTPTVRQTPQDSSVEQAWSRHRKAVLAALTGRYSSERFMDACSFFYRITGIEIRGEGDYFGWRPNEHTEEDFQKVEAWYAANHDRLYSDEATGQVKVR